MPRHLLIPPSLFALRERWLSEELAGGSPDPALLIDGFRRPDRLRWEIGIIDAAVRTDPDDGTRFIALTLMKPAHRRTNKEDDTTERWYDPAAVFVQQAHVFFGDRVGMVDSVGASGGIFHYPAIKMPGQHSFRFPRLIIDAPKGRLAKGHPDDFHDLRRRNLGRTLTQAQATAIYGGQRRPRMVRDDAIEASAKAWTERHLGSGIELASEAYKGMLEAGYALLDRHPLKSDSTERGHERSRRREGEHR